MEKEPIDRERYPGNSYSGITPRKPGETKKPEKKPAERVTKGMVVQKKKTLGSKFAETFLAVDLGSVVKHIIFDVLVPTTKETIEEIIRGSTSMMLWGDKASGRSSRGRVGRGAPYRSYETYYEDRNRERRGERGDSSPRPQSRNAIDSLIFDSRRDAEEVKDHLMDRIEEYGVASVKDFYLFSGMPTNYVQDTYGWFNLSEAVIMRVTEGFMLKLPTPVKIDD